MKEEQLFTDEEKIILKNIQKDFKWIVKDYCGVSVFDKKPYKENGHWHCNLEGGLSHYSMPFYGLFDILNGSDEPCEFRKYL